jgi:hypothetical protein
MTYINKSLKTTGSIHNAKIAPFLRKCHSCLLSSIWFAHISKIMWSNATIVLKSTHGIRHAFGPNRQKILADWGFSFKLAFYFNNRSGFEPVTT